MRIEHMEHKNMKKLSWNLRKGLYLQIKKSTPVSVPKLSTLEHIGDIIEPQE